jgi:ketosteroid isomerase-like protein
MALLCRVRNGRIATLRSYVRPAEALKAIGLRE